MIKLNFEMKCLKEKVYGQVFATDERHRNTSLEYLNTSVQELISGLLADGEREQTILFTIKILRM